MLRLIAKILKVLNSGGDPWQISLAAALGMKMNQLGPVGLDTEGAGLIGPLCHEILQVF